MDKGTVRAILGFLDMSLKGLHSIANELMDLNLSNSQEDLRVRFALEQILTAQQRVISAYELTNSAYGLTHVEQDEKASK